MQLEITKAELIIDSRVIVPNLIVAEKVLSRMVGLLGRSSLPEGTAMLLKPCSSIHTIGMRFALDIIFLDRNMCVVRTISGLPPNRFALGGRGAHAAVEMQTGWFDMSQVENGMNVEYRLTEDVVDN